MTGGNLFKAMLLRLLLASGTLLVVSLLIFITLSLIKGDAATIRLAGQAGTAQIEILRQQLALDQPLAKRYLSWLIAILQGDAGYSYISGTPVSHLLMTRGKASLLLGSTTIVLLVPLALLFGVWSGLKQGGLADRLTGIVSLTLLAVPEFVTGTILIFLFAISLHWLPALSIQNSSMSYTAGLKALILPVLTLLSVCLAQNIRQIRASTLIASRSEACQMARLNGFSEKYLICHWILPAVFINFLPLLGRYITALLSGAFVAEALFAWPGLATCLLTATQERDTPVIMAISIFICTLTVSINALLDIATLILNPVSRQRWQ